MLDPSIAKEVLESALAMGGSFAEIFLEDRLNNSLQMRNEKVENINSGRIHGAGVRVFHEMRCVYAFSNDTSREGLLDCARKIAAAVRSTPQHMNITLTPHETTSIHRVMCDPGKTEHQKRLAILREADRAAHDVSPEVVQVESRFMDWDQKIWIANSEGLFTQDRRVYTRLFVLTVASDGKENQTGYFGPGAMGGIELFDKVDPAEVGRDAAKCAVTMLHAPVCPAGVMPVIIGRGFGGVLFHEACGHSLEATSVAREQSEFCGKLGQKIAADCVTAIDDGTIPNAWGSINIDDEGTKSQKNILIENGILKSYLIDKLNSLRMGMPSTGSGRRESYKYAPTSRMTNTYIAAGNDDEKEMIATMGDGLYAVKMGGGSVDPTTGMFNFAVSEAYLVKNGVIDKPVRGASLIGRGGEVLMHIDKVSAGVESGQGMCGSISGSVPTNCGQPNIRITSMTVGGR